MNEPGDYLVLPGAGPVLMTENAPELRVDPAVHGLNAAVLEHAVPPHFLGTPHVHEREDQIAYVLAGCLSFKIGETQFEAPTGSLVVRPRAIPHVLWNPHDEPARMLEITLPGEVAGYLKALDAAVAEGTLDELRGELAERFRTHHCPTLVEGLESRLDVRQGDEVL